MGDTGLLSPPMSPDSNDRQRLFGGGAEVTTRDDGESVMLFSVPFS